MKKLPLCLLLLLGLVLVFPAVAAAQVPEPDDGVDEARLKTAFEKVREAGALPPVDRSKTNDPAYRAEYTAKRQAAMEAMKKAAESFLKAEAASLESGVGLLYQGRALLLLGKPADAAAPLARFRSEVEDHPERDRAGVELLGCLFHGTKDIAAAKALLAELAEADLPDALARQVTQLQDQLPAWEKRDSLTGKPLPAIPVLDTIGAPEGFTFEKLRGKVVLIDFWATWCPPCRVVIPELVRLQEKQAADGLQVIGLTTFYGSGWKMTSRKGDQLLGESAGGRSNPLDKAAERELNEIFHKGVPLNYPIVFTERAVGRDTFGVTGIPTVFLVDRQGKVRYHKVGSGNEEELKTWVEKLLAEPAK
ncbi:MAG: TlpA family protein disulfide reductase [Planctomycetes bacterium]|nr:TlpA family protein disulfide reductase [Planctomycetota bacterium]